MVNNPRYSICFVLDKTSMFRIISETAEDGGTAQGAAASDKGAKPTMKEVKHSVKPLQMIWNKFPGEWSAKNTLHVDDLARNFALNPKNGVRCSAYYRNDENNGDTSAAAATAGGELEGVRAVGGVVDQELPLLALYLCHVATHARNDDDDDDEPPTSSSSSSSPPAPSPSSLSSPPSAASHSAIDLQKWNHLNWREVSLGLMANAAAAASASLASLPLPPSPSGSSNSKTGGGDVGGE
mmetsp:Transcript_74324/g.140659  ORF Transcript_74324/g.140659 Transcript_74324/m.140659 type:complete len:239 (-) Transcript_74324:127-843(-)